MFKGLQRRLFWTFTALTSLVLGAALAVTCRQAAREYQTGNNLLLANTFSSIEDILSSGDAIQDSWLARLEAENLCIIHIEDNGVPLVFQGSWRPESDREHLIRLAAEAAGSAGLRAEQAVRQRVTFVLEEEGISYRGMAGVVLRQNSNCPLTLYMVQDTRAAAAHLRQMGWSYFGLWCIGTLVLALICRFQVRRSLRPTVEAVRRQREFVAAAGHELRSPLAVIKASLEAARLPRSGGAALPPEVLRYLETAGAEADRMARLTDDLLLLAGSDAGVWHTSLETLETDTFLIELYERFSPLARAAGHPLRLNLPEDALPPLRADGQRLEQLFAVLLNNALEYTPAGSPVEIAAAAHRGAVTVDIIDHGPGLTEEEKQKVFQRFYRADASRTGKAHFGLGLSVAAEIASLHHALLCVRDTPGGGATFRVQFPAAESRAILSCPGPRERV